ncbi:hypothetical protein DAEQUDRAFT_584093 [Daedalea quercina L-15889]|uniref:Uncharacterized protein n=1 Tax=Daedalea quercina L-15889 TaxID=1314783 RepID=A0A165LQ58_9APHY|nr:hypothetical protein DAEQUDRAFT_584093 [Daedalea quercina L-15889]
MCPVGLGWYRWQGWMGVTTYPVLPRSSSPSYTPFCSASGLSAYAYSFWIPMLFSECVLCALAVSRFVHMHRTRAGATLFQNGRRLIAALIRDSVWYFVVMFATYLANAIVFVVGTTTDIEILIGFSVAFVCVFANRLCLNTRGMVCRGRLLTTSGSTQPEFDATPASAHVSSPRSPRRPYDSLVDLEDGADGYDGPIVSERRLGHHVFHSFHLFLQHICVGFRPTISRPY